MATLKDVAELAGVSIATVSNCLNNTKTVKQYTPNSPTLYGTSVIGSINEEFALELQIRLWSFGGGLYDSAGRLKLDTPQNVKALQSLLDTSLYTEHRIADSSISYLC